MQDQGGQLRPILGPQQSIWPSIQNTSWSQEDQEDLLVRTVMSFQLKNTSVYHLYLRLQISRSCTTLLSILPVPIIQPAIVIEHLQVKIHMAGT